MRLPLLFRRENSAAARRERDDRVERAVTASLRALAGLLERAAGLIESRRLERGGYHKPEQFLERTTPGGRSSPAEPLDDPADVTGARRTPER